MTLFASIEGASMALAIVVVIVFVILIILPVGAWFWLITRPHDRWDRPDGWPGSWKP